MVVTERGMEMQVRSDAAGVTGVSYELQHRTQGRWFFSRDLGNDPGDALTELKLARALAEGRETGVTYQVVRQERRVMPW
jgi:hypothetical protein